MTGIGKLATSPLPVQVASRAKYLLLDSLAVYQKTRTNCPSAALLPQPDRSIGDAAFEFAYHLNRSDWDDTYYPGLLHASAVTLPAAFCLAVEYDVSGDRFLKAYCVGLEISCRIAMCIGPALLGRGLHASAVLSPLSAAITCGLLANLTESQLAQAIAIAASSAGGIFEFSRTGGTSKSFGLGMGQMAGLQAVKLVRQGYTGPARSLDGEFGFLNILAGIGSDRFLEVFSTALDRKFFCLFDIRPKRYDVNALAHAALEAVFSCIEAAGKRSWSEIVVEISPSAAMVLNIDSAFSPKTLEEARYHLPTMILAANDYGEVSSSVLVELLGKCGPISQRRISIRVSDNFTGEYAFAAAATIPEIETGRVLLNQSSWREQNAFPTQALNEKVDRCAGTKAEELKRMVHHLGGDQNIRIADLWQFIHGN